MDGHHQRYMNLRGSSVGVPMYFHDTGNWSVSACPTADPLGLHSRAPKLPQRYIFDCLAISYRKHVVLAVVPLMTVSHWLLASCTRCWPTSLPPTPATCCRNSTLFNPQSLQSLHTLARNVVPTIVAAPRVPAGRGFSLAGGAGEVCLAGVRAHGALLRGCIQLGCSKMH